MAAAPRWATRQTAPSCNEWSPSAVVNWLSLSLGTLRASFESGAHLHHIDTSPDQGRLVLMALGASTWHTRSTPARTSAPASLSTVGGAVGGAQLTVRTARGAPLRAPPPRRRIVQARRTAAGSYWLDVEAPPSRSTASLDLAGARSGANRARSVSVFQRGDGHRRTRDESPTRSLGAHRDGARARPSSRSLATIAMPSKARPASWSSKAPTGRSRPSCGGFTVYQCVNLVDGVRLNTPRSVPGPISTSLHRSESGRAHRAMLGPASAQFGSDAMEAPSRC